MQGMLVSGLGKPTLAVQLLVGAELARQRVGAASVGVGHALCNDALLAFERPDARLHDFDGGSIVAHVALQRRQLGIGADQFVAQPRGQRPGRLGAPARVYDAFAIAKGADLTERRLEAGFGLSDLMLGMADRVVPRPRRQLVDQLFRCRDDRLRQLKRVARGERPHPHHDGAVGRVVERVDLPTPILHQRLDRGRPRQPCPPIRLGRRKHPAQIERAVEFVDDRAAGDVLDDDLRFDAGRRMVGIAGQQRQRVEARRIDAAQAETELRHVLVGGDDEQIRSRHRDRHQHQRDKRQRDR